MSASSNGSQSTYRELRPQSRWHDCGYDGTLISIQIHTLLISCGRGEGLQMLASGRTSISATWPTTTSVATNTTNTVATTTATTLAISTLVNCQQSSYICFKEYNYSRILLWPSTANGSKRISMAAGNTIPYIILTSLGLRQIH